MHPLFSGITDGKFVKEKNFFNFPSLKSDIPLYDRISFVMGVGDLKNILDGKKDGYFYARSGHPNKHELERLLTLAEVPLDTDPFDTIVASEGMKIISAVRDTLAKGMKGKRIICDNSTYISTRVAFTDNLPEQLKETIFIDMSDYDQVKKTLKQNKKKTVFMMTESLTNPFLKTPNIRSLANLANEYDTVLLIDNTLLTPYYLQPIYMGAHGVIHSLTKYLSGDDKQNGGSFTSSKKAVEAVRSLIKNDGGSLSHKDAYNITNNLHGLPERMEIHSHNSEMIANWLGEPKNRDYVGKVYYPTIEGVTRKDKWGGVVSFQLKGYDENDLIEKEIAFMKAVDNNEFLENIVSFGAPETRCVGEYTLGYPREEIKKLNFPPGLIRLGVGRENSMGKIKTGIESCFKLVYKK